MGLVERVVGKVVDILIDGLGRLLRDAVCHAARNVPLRIAVEECLPLLLDLGGLFLGDGPAHHVRLPQRVSRQLLEDLDHLLLVDDAPVGDGEDRLQGRVEVLDLAGVMLAGDEPGDGVHGAGAVERDDGGDVLDVLGPQAHAHAGHARGLHLEHAGGLAGRDHLKGLRVVLRDVRELEVRQALLDHLHRVIQHRQVPQPQEVHLQEAQLLQGGHDVLAHHGVVVLRQGHVLVHRPLGDDHAGGVGGGVAGHPLQGLGGVDELFHLLIGLVLLPQGLGQAQGVVQGDVEGAGPGGHLLGDHVHVGIGHVHHPAHVPDHAPGGHGAEGDDLGHVVIPVLPADVVHHLAPAGVAEVHVDIRHADPLRVQEPLEVQVVLHGVDVRDVEAVADHAARGAAPAGTHGDACASGIADEVGDDQEVVGEAHLLDHVLLVPELVPVLVIRSIPLPVALVAELFQIGKAVVPLRQPEFRQVVLAEGKVQIAHVGDLRRVLQRALVAREQGRHLLLAAEVEVPGLIAHPVLVVDGLAGLDAQQYIVGLRVLLPEVVRVVGAHHRQPRLPVDAEDALVHDGLVPDAVVLELQIEAVRAEDVGELQGIGLGVLVLPVPQPPGDLPGEAGRQGDQSPAVLPQQLQVDPGLDIEALCPAHGHQVGQVPVALLVLAEQHQMAALRVQLVDLVEPGPALGGDVHLAADDRLDPLRLAGAVKVHGTVHDAVVRDSAGGLAHGLHDAGQVPDAAGAVQ